MYKSLIFYFLLNLFPFAVLSQINPEFELSGKIKEYTKNDFNTDSQFWTVKENKDGIVFFGNNDGVVVFDGEHWNTISLPNHSSVRSLEIDKSGTIYAGGYNEIGIVQKNKSGRYYYRSLIEDLQLEGRNIENIWDIHATGSKVLARAFNELIIISGKTATHIPATTSFIYAALAGKDYFIQDTNLGILRLNDKGIELSMAFAASEYNNEEITSILPGNVSGSIMAITKPGNIYEGTVASGKLSLVNNIFNHSQRDQVSGAIRHSNGTILIGTLDSKIIPANAKGEILPAPALFKDLENAVIHRLYKAQDGNLWILQNNGVAYIDFRSPYTYLFNKASVYDVLVNKNLMYLATNQGVYYSPFDPDNASASYDFKKVANLHGQAWSIQLLDGDVIASHDNGLFRITEGKALKIGTTTGFWKVTPIAYKKGFYLASHYNGLYLLEKKGPQWLLHPKISGFDESARDIMAAQEPGTYWICHGYKGVFRVRINQDFTRVNSVDHFTNKNGLASPFNVNVTKWRGDIVFTTNTGIYTFDNSQNRFVPHKTLNSILTPSKNTRKLVEYGNRTWFVQDDEAGYFFTAEKQPALHKDLFLNLKGTFNRGMECIASLPGNKVLFGTINGLFLYNTGGNRNDPEVNTLITQVTYLKDRELNLLPLVNRPDEPQVLPNQTDILRFEFTAPKMTHGTGIQYSYMLENVDKTWSGWQNISYKEYTHLRPGQYTFKVKSRNAAGVIGKETAYHFTILPKWYQTWFAYIMYVVLAALLVWLVIRYLNKRIEKENIKAHHEAQKSKKLLELELEQLRLQHDKEEIQRDKVHLEEDVLMKSKELANYTMLLIKKKDIFAELTDDLKELREYVRNEESRKKLFEIFQKLNRHKIGDEYMEVFDVNFEKVHHNFFEELKKINPTLTKRELRLCAFVKMDLSNKEISPLLNISLRGVENARYRIRKKLNVAHEDNFVEFLENLSKEEVEQ